jgi:hypothetical protein
MYRCPDALNFASFAAAARAGNPNGVVAFNPGVYNRLRSLTPYEDYLYVMASSSRGKFPPKFNGMLWTTGGDTRKWGAQYWGANQSCLYNALFATNRLELIDPMFEMYSNMYGSCALSARQQWGSKGIYIPETVAFDGLEKLSESIA